MFIPDAFTEKKNWWMLVMVSLIYYRVVLSDRCLFFPFQVARNSLHRPAVVLRLSRLHVLDGVMVTLEERTRAELLSTDPSVRTAHNTYLYRAIAIIEDTEVMSLFPSAYFPPGTKMKFFNK